MKVNDTKSVSIDKNMISVSKVRLFMSNTAFLVGVITIISSLFLIYEFVKEQGVKEEVAKSLRFDNIVQKANIIKYATPKNKPATIIYVDKKINGTKLGYELGDNTLLKNQNNVNESILFILKDIQTKQNILLTKSK